jgi:hypothetical protein
MKTGGSGKREAGSGEKGEGRREKGEGRREKGEGGEELTGKHLPLLLFPPLERGAGGIRF